VTMQLVKTTLAIPVRIELALRRRQEREYRAKAAGLAAIGEDVVGGEVKMRGGILNERVFKVLELIVGSEAEDDAEDVALREREGVATSGKR